MQAKRLWWAPVVMLLALSAAAQVTTTGTPVTNTVPMFTGTATIGNSPVSVSGSNVGIGTMTPGAKLDVADTVLIHSGLQKLSSYTIGAVTSPFYEVLGVEDVPQGGTNPNIAASGFGFVSGANQASPVIWMYDFFGQNSFRVISKGYGTSIGTDPVLFDIDATGNVGIGTTAPNSIFEVDSPVSKAATTGWVNIQSVGSSHAADGTNQLQLVTQMYTSTTSLSRAMGLQAVEQNTGFRNLALQYDGGNVGIGTTNPGAALEVNGSVKLTSGSGASITFADGTIQSTAWNGTLCGGDYAESVDVSGDRTRYEPGDVIVIDPNHPARFLKSTDPYSTAIAGIYSTKPGFVGRRQVADPKTNTTEIPMAMVGVVPTKVSAENGPIKPGDLLVTSSTLGHAMKGTDRSLLVGAIVGKALGSLGSGTGVIEVLVSLQ
jgi:hypothetical protein